MAKKATHETVDSEPIEKTSNPLIKTRSEVEAMSLVEKEAFRESGGTMTEDPQEPSSEGEETN